MSGEQGGYHVLYPGIVCIKCSAITSPYRAASSCRKEVISCWISSSHMLWQKKSCFLAVFVLDILFPFNLYLWSLSGPGWAGFFGFVSLGPLSGLISLALFGRCGNPYCPIFLCISVSVYLLYVHYVNDRLISTQIIKIIL